MIREHFKFQTETVELREKQNGGGTKFTKRFK
jgi:hypothetical protein